MTPRLQAARPPKLERQMKGMKRSEYWKNFHLGTEIDIAGTFIFNGLRRFHEMETLYYHSDVFEVLYNLAVGVERLLKVGVILIEHDDGVDQESFEQSLITHSHQDLMRRVQAKHDLNLTGPHNEFLALLGEFYTTHRYGRYTLSADKHAEKQLLHRYIEKNLGITIEDTFPFQITSNDNRIRKLIGNRVGKLTKGLYKVIEDEARRLGIFTYELRSNSKAEKIFLCERFDFIDEDVLWKELLVFFLNSEKQGGIFDFLKSIDPLPFDEALATDYLQCFGSDEKKLAVLDELECVYEDVENVKGRLEKMDVIANPLVLFDDDECDDAESEE
jgi:hypothetical protein